jgi:glutamate formiminotransferase
VFSLVKKMAQQLGEDTNGSELIGLIPLKAFHTKNDFFDEYDLDKKIEYLGLNAVKSFSKEANIIEYKLGI